MGQHERGLRERTRSGAAPGQRAGAPATRRERAASHERIATGSSQNAPSTRLQAFRADTQIIGRRPHASSTAEEPDDHAAGLGLSLAPPDGTNAHGGGVDGADDPTFHIDELGRMHGSG